MRWLSRFTFGDPADIWEPRLPVGQWRHSVTAIGTGRKTGTGVPGVTLIHRQQRLIVPVRFFEDELPDFMRLVEWGQTKAPFLWLPDRDPAAPELEMTVILAAPRIADTVSPTPDGEYERVSFVDLTFRQVSMGQES